MRKDREARKREKGVGREREEGEREGGGRKERQEGRGQGRVSSHRFVIQTKLKLRLIYAVKIRKKFGSSKPIEL